MFYYKCFVLSTFKTYFYNFCKYSIYFVVPLKGAHSPGPRVVSKGVYNIQNVKSLILGQEDVSFIK